MSIEKKSDLTTVANGATMGTRYSALFWTRERIETARIHNALQDAVDQVDNQMSTWKPQSDLMRLNTAVPGEWQKAPSALLKVLELSDKIRLASDGAFDVSIGDLVNAWGFGPDSDQPNVKALQKINNSQTDVPQEHLELDIGASSVRRLSSRAIDLSGIAKGFGVDQLALVLEGFGIHNYLVSIDGELRAAGKTETGENWTIGVEEPDINERKIRQQFELLDLSVATSGNYRHFFLIGDETLSHTMDPVTFQPVKSNISSVTVFAKDCVTADAWATAIWVGGADLAKKAKQNGFIAGSLLFFDDGSASEI